MKAVIYENFKQLPSIQNVADPKPSDEGVVVKVEATGVCRSDWHGWVGHDPDIQLPHIPGHELAGVICAVGKNTKHWNIGDRVTVPFVAGCGRCAECDVGDQQVCAQQFQPGFTAWGSFAEYVALDYADTNIVALPDSIEFSTAASLGCRFVTAYRAVVDQGKLHSNQWVAVHGCGGVGLSAIMIAKAKGARVIAIDIKQNSLDFAKDLGADYCLNAIQTTDIVEAIQDISNGGVHLSIDALGSSITSFNSINCLKRRGKHIQVGLMVADNAHAKVPMDRILAYELEIIGSHGMQAHRYPEMLNMILSGQLAPQKLVSREISLEQSIDVLTTMDEFSNTGVTVITSF